MRALLLLLALLTAGSTQAAILRFTADPATLPAGGGSVTFVWRADSGSCTISGLGQTVSVPRTGTQVAVIEETATFTFRCVTSGVVARRSITVTVAESEEPPTEPPPTEPPPPVTNCSNNFRAIPDPCAHFGFDVFGDFPIDQTISGTQSGSKTIGGTGTAANPYVIDARQATFNVGSGSLTVQGKYVILLCGKINSTGEGPFRPAATYSVYRGCDIGGNQTNHGHGSVMGPAGNTLFDGFRVHNFGLLGASAPEQDQHGWKVKATNVWILNSQGYELSGDGVQCGDASNGSCSNVYIGGGRYHHNRENAIDIKDSQNVVVSGVRMDGFRPTSSSPGEAVIIHDDAFGARILDNVITDSTLGVVTSGRSGHEIDGNNITALSVGIRCRNTSNVKITNNVISAPTPVHRQSGCSGTIQQ